MTARHAPRVHPVQAWQPGSPSWGLFVRKQPRALTKKEIPIGTTCHLPTASARPRPMAGAACPRARGRKGGERGRCRAINPSGTTSLQREAGTGAGRRRRSSGPLLVLSSEHHGCSFVLGARCGAAGSSAAPPGLGTLQQRRKGPAHVRGQGALTPKPKPVLAQREEPCEYCTCPSNTGQPDTGHHTASDARVGAEGLCNAGRSEIFIRVFK